MCHNVGSSLILNTIKEDTMLSNLFKRSMLFVAVIAAMGGCQSAKACPEPITGTFISGLGWITFALFAAPTP
jgi:hypothetical protein